MLCVFCRCQPLGLIVIGVGLYLLLWKGNLLAVVFEMPYIEDSVIIIIFCGGAILLLAIFGLIANVLANFRVLAVVSQLIFTPAELRRLFFHFGLSVCLSVCPSDN